MKLSVYLIRETVDDFDGVVQAKYLNGDDAFFELNTIQNLPYTCKAFVQKNKAKPPRWLPFLATHFNTANLGLLNSSNSFVLLVKVSGRLFAVTFGHGFQAIDRSKIEPRFGLMVSASCLNPGEIRTLESNLIDTITRNKRTHVSKGSGVSEFDLNPHVDWVRKLSGKPKSTNLAKFVSGSDSVCIAVDCDLESVGAKCNELLAVYQSDEYKEAFQYLDHLRPLGKHEPGIVELEASLVERLEAKSHERLSIAFPEIPDEELLDHYKICCGHRAVECDELTLEAVYEFITNEGMDSNPANIRIVGVGDQQQPVTKMRSLREYLVCELERDGETFIFCLGHWFRAERDYVQNIRSEVGALDDITAALALPPLRNGESEGHYNNRLSDDKEWPLMDKDNFHIGNTYDKLEVCDLLTPESHLLCVKKMERSSTLSHLFAQGSVSAALLRESEAYRTTVNQTAHAQWPDAIQLTADNLGNATIVYAIATRKLGPLAESMFFFSLVNLLNHVRAVRRVGCKVAICKIGYEEDAPQPVAYKRKKKVHQAQLIPIKKAE